MVEGERGEDLLKPLAREWMYANESEIRTGEGVGDLK